MEHARCLDRDATLQHILAIVSRHLKLFSVVRTQGRQPAIEYAAAGYIYIPLLSFCQPSRLLCPYRAFDRNFTNFSCCAASTLNPTSRSNLNITEPNATTAHAQSVEHILHELKRRVQACRDINSSGLDQDGPVESDDTGLNLVHPACISDAAFHAHLRKVSHHVAFPH